MKPIRSSSARSNFDYSIADVDILLQVHDAETKGAVGRPDRQLEVFKRAGIILTVTAWEAYVEDTLSQQFREKLGRAAVPADISSAFNAASDVWLNSKPKPPDVAKWAGDGWKTLVLEQFDQEVKALNTPNSDKVRVLFKRYLGLDLKQSWKWQKTSSDMACNRLDALIRLRGELVHRGREWSQSKASAHRSHLDGAKKLVSHLVECTDIALGIAPEVIEIPDQIQ